MKITYSPPTPTGEMKRTIPTRSPAIMRDKFIELLGIAIAQKQKLTVEIRPCPLATALLQVLNSTPVFDGLLEVTDV